MSEPRVVLAEYFTTQETTLLFIITPGAKEPLVSEIPITLADIRLCANTSFGSAQISGLDESTWQQRFQLLIKPLYSHTTRGDLIWFVPHDALHYLPLHTLQIEGIPLIERNPVCYTPSASVMKFCQQRRRANRDYHSAFVVGDSQGDLFYARAEARIIAALFATTPYLQQQANKGLIIRELSRDQQPDILHFSCHGYFDPQYALKSGIVLNAEQEKAEPETVNLTAEEIFSLSLNTGLVTLSACETGVNERRSGDELMGLTRALVYAGAPSVIVSLWRVNDLSSSLLMQYFYQQLRLSPHNISSIKKASALQAAQIYLKHLTAQQLSDYCIEQFHQQKTQGNEEQALVFQSGLAYAQTHAGDIQSALTSYQTILQSIEAIQHEDVYKIGHLIKRTIRLLKIKARRPSTINYQTQPFKTLYHWAPFILVGDWQ